jgi:hypothetical protein
MSRKPLHIFTVLVLVVIAGLIVSNWGMLHRFAGPPNPYGPRLGAGLMAGLGFRLLVTTAVEVLQLAGLAVIVEIADTIRWRSLTDDERGRAGRRYLLGRLGGFKG